MTDGMLSSCGAISARVRRLRGMHDVGLLTVPGGVLASPAALFTDGEDAVLKRPALLLVLLLALLFIVASVRWTLAPAPGVTLENARRLHNRMDRRTVEAILGSSATREKKYDNRWADLSWYTRSCIIEVHYDYLMSRVVRVHCAYANAVGAREPRKASDYIVLRNIGSEDTIIARLRGWLGL